MRKILLAATILTGFLSGEAAAATSKNTSLSTITYNGITYKYSSVSTCPDGKSALRLYRKWWCPLISSSTTAATTTDTTSTTGTSTTSSSTGTTTTDTTTTSTTTTGTNTTDSTATTSSTTTTSGADSTVSGTTSTTTAATTTSTPPSYNANISWTVPTVHADGTPLALSELSGYEIYYTNDTGSVSVSIPVSGGDTVNTVVSNLPSGNYYFSIAAIGANGLKSTLSNIAALNFP